MRFIPLLIIHFIATCIGGNNILISQELNLKFHHLTVENGLSQNTIRGIVKDKYGFMWFGTWEGVCRYDGYNFKIFRANENDSTALTNNRINFLFKDQDNIVWVVTGDQFLCRYNYETENFTRFPREKLPEYLIKELQKNSRYERTHVRNSHFSWEINDRKTELIQVNNKTQNQVRYRKNPFDVNSLSDYILTDMYLDVNNILWVGTESGGVNKADTRAKPFINYSYSPVTANSLIDNVIRAICEDKSGNIWVGTNNRGITVISPEKGTFKHIRNPENENSPLTANQIRSMHCDRFGNIWIGTKRGLTSYNPSSNKFSQYKSGSNKPIPHNWVFWIMEDHSGYLWIGTFNGIAKYDRKNDRFYSYRPDSMLLSKNVRVILEDHKYNFWIATEGGGITLLKRDSAEGFHEKLTPVRHYTYSPNDSNSLINNIVLTMAEDENKIIWIGTNNGLCSLNPANNTINKVDVNKGFPDNLIMGIICDFKGNIWISHKKGLTRLNINNQTMRTYTKSDGLQGNEFTQNAYYRSKRTGKVYFGGTNGMSVFYPDSIKDNQHFPNIVFTSLKVLNQPVQINQKVNDHIILTESIVTTKKITLHYSHKSFAIEFAGLHFSNPPENKYKYKLEGFDNNWIETDGSDCIANYSTLPPKKYIFKVMASNSDGLWNPEPAVMHIVVLPPWWRSWWAYIFYIFLVFVVLFFIYKNVVSRMEFRNQIALERLKAEQMHELDQLKLEFFTNVSHELRTPLSLIIDPLEKIYGNEVEKTKIRGYYALMLKNARRLLKLVNQLLDFRKIESAKLKLELTQSDIIAFCKDITEMFAIQAGQRKIALRFNPFVDKYITLFDPDKLDKILFNLVFNAFKYTPDGGSIDVTITKSAENDSETLHIAVSDTGIGIPAESIHKVFDIFYQVEGNKTITGEGTGLGLALTKKLTELHKGEITVESRPGKGSCFTVTLPVGLLKEQYHKVDAVADNKKPFINENYSASLDDNIITNAADTDSSLPQLLIIEDNTDVRSYLMSELSAGYVILESDNGKDGLSKAIDVVPDLIISDIMMPEIDGIELCKKLKTDERTSHIPVILLTARQSEKYKIEGYETGADAYVTKPFNTTVLKAQIKSLIASRQKLREIFGKENNLDLRVLAVNVTDEAFLNKAIDMVKQNISEPNFDTEILSAKLKMSQRQLYRKIRALTNQTVHDFVTTIRLNVAVELLLSGDFTISEVAYKVGYSEPTNFTRSFTKKYGKNPTSFIQEFRNIY